MLMINTAHGCLLKITARKRAVENERIFSGIKLYRNIGIFIKMSNTYVLKAYNYSKNVRKDVKCPVDVRGPTLMSPASGPSLSNVCRALAMARMTPCIAGVSIICGK